MGVVTIFFVKKILNIINYWERYLELIMREFFLKYLKIFK